MLLNTFRFYHNFNNYFLYKLKLKTVKTLIYKYNYYCRYYYFYIYFYIYFYRFFIYKYKKLL